MPMIYILKKFFRDLRGHLPQMTTISIIIGIGVAFFIGLYSTYNGLNNTISDYYKQSNLAELYAYGNSISEHTIEDIQQTNYIKNVESRIQFIGQIHDADVVINSLTQTINKPNILEGKLPDTQSKEIALDHLFMEENNLSVGDSITIELSGTELQLTISGKVQSSEYLYQVKDSTQPVPNHKTYGYALMDKDYLEDNLHFSTNQLLVTTNGSDKDKIQQSLEEKHSDLIFVTNQKNSSYAMFDSKLKTIKNMALVLPLVFCVLAILITLISMVRYVENQRQAIAIMKAIGHPNNVIYFSILIFPTITVILGSVIGSSLGILIFPDLLIHTLNILFDFPELHTSSFILPLTLFNIVLLLLENLVTFLTCWKMIQEKPATLLRPKVPKKVTHSVIEKFSFWDKVHFGNKLVFFNIKLNKTRFFLSSIGLIFSVCLIISSVGLKFSLTEIIETEFSSNRQYDISATLASPYDYQSSVHYTIDSVTSYDAYSLVQAKIGSKTTKLNIIDNEHSSIQIIDDQHQLIDIEKANGIYISSKLMSELKLEKGDTIQLSILNNSGKNSDITVTIIGSYLSYTSQGIYTSFTYLSEKGLNIPVSSLLIKTDNIDKASKSLSSNELFSSYTIKNNQRIDYTTASKSIDDMVVLMIVASVLLLFTIIYNISSINIFERTRDIATEKVLGLKDSEINTLVLKENIILVTFSTLVGSLLSFKFYILLCTSLAPEDMAFPEKLNWLSFPISFVLLSVFLFLTNLFLKPKIKKIDMLGSLKSIE